MCSARLVAALLAAVVRSPPAPAASSPSAATSTRIVSSRTSASRAGPSAEPSQASSARSDSAQAAVDERARHPQERACPTRRDPQLVEVLRVGAEARARVVQEHAPVLLGERQRYRLERRSVLGDHDRLRDLGEIERAEELRPQRPRLGTGPCGAPSPASQRALVPFEQLHLELAEAPDDVHAVEHRDVVLDDLGAVRARSPSRRVRSRATGTRSRPCRWATSSEVISCGGRAGGPGLLELDAVRAVRQLQLPQPGAVLEPVTERDPVSREAEVGGVVVGGDEDARRQRLAERRQHEAVARRELQLPFDGLAHLLSVVAYRVHNRLRLVNVPRPCGSP